MELATSTVSCNASFSLLLDFASPVVSQSLCCLMLAAIGAIYILHMPSNKSHIYIYNVHTFKSSILSHFQFYSLPIPETYIIIIYSTITLVYCKLQLHNHFFWVVYLVYILLVHAEYFTGLLQYTCGTVLWYCYSESLIVT